MIDLTTRYLGLTLRTPLRAFRFPLVAGDREHSATRGCRGVCRSALFSFRRATAAGVAGTRPPSVDRNGELRRVLDLLSPAQRIRLGPEGYLEHIRKAKEAVDIPIIASLNGATVGGWTKFAQEIEQAGARRPGMQYLLHSDRPRSLRLRRSSRPMSISCGL